MRTLLVVIALTAPAAATTRYAGPWGYPTIQAAVDAAVPGDTIQVYPQTWKESVHIAKSLTIEQLPNTEGYGDVNIVGTSAGTIIVDLHNGEPLLLRHLTLRGTGGPVVKGPTVIAQRAPFVSLENVVIVGGTAGVVNLVNLTLRSSRIEHTTGAGIAIIGAATIDDCVVQSTGGAGIAINTLAVGMTTNHIRTTQVLAPLGFGIQIDNARAGAFVLDTVAVDGAAGMGIYLDNADGASLSNVTVTNTQPAAGGGWGDGIVVWNAEQVTVTGSVIEANARAGVSALGCDATPAQIGLHDVDLVANPIDLDAEPSGSCEIHAQIDDLGANQCYDPSGQVRTCVVLSSTITSPKPPGH